VSMGILPVGLIATRSKGHSLHLPTEEARKRRAL
jgi:hypothetical protein